MSSKHVTVSKWWQSSVNMKHETVSKIWQSPVNMKQYLNDDKVL